jgi:hypothetical protein
MTKAYPSTLAPLDAKISFDVQDLQYVCNLHRNGNPVWGWLRFPRHYQCCWGHCHMFDCQLLSHQLLSLIGQNVKMEIAVTVSFAFSQSPFCV